MTIIIIINKNAMGDRWLAQKVFQTVDYPRARKAAEQFQLGGNRTIIVEDDSVEMK